MLSPSAPFKSPLSFTDHLIAAFLLKPLLITLIGHNLLLMVISTDVCYYMPGTLVVALSADCFNRHNRHGQFHHRHHFPHWRTGAREAKRARGHHRPGKVVAMGVHPGHSAQRCGRGCLESRHVTILRTASHLFDCHMTPGIQHLCTICSSPPKL